MTPFIDVRFSSALPPRPPRGMIRWVCTSNPFYVLSAGLFLAGLWISFGEQAEEEETWALMSGLAGYTLLLAVTACLLVRFFKVWDDVRTLLLLVVLMFLATSITFDSVLTVDPERGSVCYLAGLALAVLVSEGVLRGIRLRLPALFRVPYFLAPFGLALTVLLLEIGLVLRRTPHAWGAGAERGVFGVALSLPLGLIALTLIGHQQDWIYTEFRALFAARLGGDPLLITTLA